MSNTYCTQHFVFLFREPYKIIKTATQYCLFQCNFYQFHTLQYQHSLLTRGGGWFNGVLTLLSTIFQTYRGSVLLVEETGIHGESHRKSLTNSHNVVSSTPRHERGSNSQL